MKIRLKLGSALLIFVTTCSSAFALILDITNDGGTAADGNIQVYNSSQVLVSSCTTAAGCSPSLQNTPPDTYTLIASPANAATDVVSGFSDCPQGGTTLGNSCTFFLDTDAEVFVIFDLRDNFTVYDQDADGIDDATELALNANPFAFDTYPDTDSDGLPDIIETQVTHTDINTNDSSICSNTGVEPVGVDDLTGQWDVRWVEGDSITAGHDFNDGDDIDATDTKKEWVAAFSICHTNTSLQIFDQYFGYADSASFNGSTVTATFIHPQDGTTTFSATYTSGGGDYNNKGRFEDLNTTLEDIAGAQMRADRRMEKADLANLTAANISGTFGVQLTIYDSESDQLIEKPYNPATVSVDFRATETTGKVMMVNLISTNNFGEASASRGYYIPSIASFYSLDRTPNETGLDLDGDGSNDDQLLDDSKVSFTFVEAPVNGVGGMLRGELEDQQLNDFDSDFFIDFGGDYFAGGAFANLYGKGTAPSLSMSTLNLQIGIAPFNKVVGRATVVNVPNSSQTITYTSSLNPNFLIINDKSNFISTSNRIVGYTDGDRTGSHHSKDNNGVNVTAKSDKLSSVPGNIFPTDSYTVRFTGDGLSAADDIAAVTHTDYSTTPLPFTSNVRLDNRSLKTDFSGTRLINADSVHTLTWNKILTGGFTNTGASLYRVLFEKADVANDTEVGISGAKRLQINIKASDCGTGTICRLSLPKDTFNPNESYFIRIVAFEKNNSTNRSITSKYYVSAASATTGCNINSNSFGSITNGSPCAEYYKVQNPRKAGSLVTDTTTFLDYAVNRPIGTPKAIVVLLAGGQGYAGVIGDYDENGNLLSDTTKQTGLNFLTRSAEMFADQGYLAVTIDRPTDEPKHDFSYEFDNYRISPRHAHDIASVLNEVNTQNLNVFLAGTSRAGISVLNQFKVASAISMSVPVNSNAFYYTDDPLYVDVVGDHPVGQTGEGEIAPGDVYVPVHYLTNPNEACGVTAPTTPGDQTVFVSFANSGQNQFDSVSTFGNGVTKFGDACKSMHDHGFFGSELAAVTATTNWFDNLALLSNKPPVTRPIRQFTLPDTDIVFSASSIGTIATDVNGDPISVDVASGSSTRGGTFVGDEMTGTLTYTPPVGANNITDAIVFIAEDDQGGRTSMIVTIDISDDANADGLPDSIYPTDGSNGNAIDDNDGDALSLLDEYQAGTDPSLSDTDGDGFDDLFEITNGLNPTVFNDPNFDTDGDGFTDGEEAAIAGSDLFDASINPGFISFANATPSVQEDAGTANISVTRSGGTLGAVSVNCSSSDVASAIAGIDYDAVNITLNWANGVGGTQSCDITITADSDIEGDETFKLDISNPSGGAKLAP